MVECATATNRVPRGTEIVAQAFFAAVEEIPDNRRDGVIKAALVLISREAEWSLSGQHTWRTDIPLITRGEDEAHRIEPWLMGVACSRGLSSATTNASKPLSWWG
jgi:hypothetical protein